MFPSNPGILRLLPLLTVFALFLTGCESIEKYSLTSRLWRSGDFLKTNEPAKDPRVALFRSPDVKSVLVVYDAYSDRRDQVRRQAYFLSGDPDSGHGRHKPRMVDPGEGVGMLAIAFKPAANGTPGAGESRGIYATMAEGGHGFVLHGGGFPQKPYSLPVYIETSGRAVQVLLTPFAVAGDAVMAGGVVAFGGFIVMARTGFIPY